MLAIVFPDCRGALTDKLTNLTEVTWYNGINSQAKLQKALASEWIFSSNNIFEQIFKSKQSQLYDVILKLGDADVFQAGVFLGVHESEYAFETKDPNLNLDSVKYDVYKKNKMPVMGDPSDKTSDLSLEEFLRSIAYLNIKNATNPKTIKLVFKSNEALSASVGLIQSYKVSINWVFYRQFRRLILVFHSVVKAFMLVWISAEILEGPGCYGISPDVDKDQYFDSVKQLKDASKHVWLSIGWNTNWTPGTTEYYSQDEALMMMMAVTKNLNNTLGMIDFPIIFPVRAAFAERSQESLTRLFWHIIKHKTLVALEIWSPETDVVDVKQLQEFIHGFGIPKLNITGFNPIFLNVPQKLRDQMDLSKSSAVSALRQFGILNFASILFAIIMKNFIQWYKMM